ncbi:MAG: hypothetical protein KGK30_07410, partial [Elusimicrobia bacterium]|nr:hypothetical protein [Elusimicrobiota bacterium]
DLDKCDFTKQSAAACIVNQSGNTATIYANNSNYVGCTLTTSGSTAATPSQTVPGVANIGPAAPGAQSKGGAATAESTLVSVCTTIQQQLDALQSQGGGSNASAGISAVRTQKQKILNESAVAAANIMAAAGALSEGKQTSYSCAGQSAAAVLSDGNNILNMLDATKNQLIGKEPSGIYPTLGASLKATQDSVGVFLTGDKLKIQDGKISEAIQKYQVALSVTRIDSTRLQAAKAAVQKELDVLIKGPGLLADPNLGRNLNIAQVVPTKDVVNAATVNLKASNKALEGTEALLGTAKTNSQNADIGAKALSSDSEQKQYLGVTSQIQAQYDKTNALYGAAMKDWTAQSGALNAAAGEIGSPGLISQASKAAQDAKSYTTEKTPTSPVVSVQSMYTTAAQELSKNPPCPTFAANSKSVEEGLSKTQGTGARVIAAANEQRKKVSDATTALSGLQ